MSSFNSCFPFILHKKGFSKKGFMIFAALILCVAILSPSCNSDRHQAKRATDESKRITDSTNTNQAKTETSEKDLSAPINQENVKIEVIPYDTLFWSYDDGILSVACFVLPQLVPLPIDFDIDSIEIYYNASPTMPGLKKYDQERCFSYKTETIKLEITEVNEVGFSRRYDYMLEAEVYPGARLLNGIQIGGLVAQLIPHIPLTGVESSMPRLTAADLAKLKEIRFNDHWSIYQHSYLISDGIIEKLIVKFE